LNAVLAAVSPSAAAAERLGLFVSTALDYWHTEQAKAFARDVQINDTVYRRLDPEYYAWLRSRMVVARRAAAAGRLDAAAFEDLRVRFNAVHDGAVAYFGEDRLREAVRRPRAADYQPPVADGDHRRVPVPRLRRSAGDHISPEAIALVDGIAEKAVALGWRPERLYALGNRIFDPHRGLTCFLKSGDRIGAVTLQSIEIIHPLPSEVHHRFYNPDVDQPWIRRVAVNPTG
jgi:hypothetical protein